MNIDFIKWMATISVNHDYLNNLGGVQVYSKDEGNNNQLLEFNSNGEMVAGLKSIYRDLPQSAIEGVNYKQGNFVIDQMPFDIKIIALDNSTKESFHMPHSRINQAKKSALKYIYEQELKK